MVHYNCPFGTFPKVETRGTDKYQKGLKMSKKNASSVVAGAGFVADLFLRLQKAVANKGGSDEDIYRLVKPEGEEILQKVAETIVGTKTGQSVENLLADWQRFWAELGFSINPDEIVVPVYKPGFDRLLVIPQGLTINQAYDLCAKQFSCWRYTGDLDAAVVQNDRDPKNGSYAIWVRDRVEADEELKNLSANQLKERNVQSITLLERLVYELKYYLKTKKHLDIQNWTLCSGSRNVDGYVPYCRWHSDYVKLSVCWCDPDDRRGSLRSRAAVSN